MTNTRDARSKNLRKFLEKKYGITDALFVDFKEPADVTIQRNKIETDIILPFINKPIP